jgi:hypothetical protein
VTAASGTAPGTVRASAPDAGARATARRQQGADDRVRAGQFRVSRCDADRPHDGPDAAFVDPSTGACLGDEPV